MMTIMSPPTSSARSTASVQDWFQSQLEDLGIESVYSRYIISLLLQQDNYRCSADPDLASSPECTRVVGGCADGTARSYHHQHHHHHRLTVSNNNNNNNNNSGDTSRSTAAAVENKNAAVPGNNNNNYGKCGGGSSSSGGNGTGGAGNGRKQRSASRRDRQQPWSAEQRKKREAVGCLLEICDDIIAGDIEDLIEELMLRLKQVDKTSTTRPVISPPANNNNPTSTKINIWQDPAEQYYAAFPALSTETRMTSLTQSSQVTLISGTDVSNVWKKKQQQSQKLAPTLSTQVDNNSINSESTPTASRSSNASSRRRRGCFSHHGNKENLHKPPFHLRGKDDHRGSRYSSHTNRLRGGRGRSGRLLVSETRQKLSQASSSQPSARKFGTRQYESGVSSSAPQTTSDSGYCLNVENILKDILKTANKNSSRSGKVGLEREAPYTHHFVVPKMESGFRSYDGRSLKKPTCNLTGKGFEENSAWYDVSFLDNSNTPNDKDVPSVSPPPLSIMGVGPSSDEKNYVRLYKRHSYLPSSPRSVLTLEGLGEKDVFRKFTSRLGSSADSDPDSTQKIVVTASIADLVKNHLAPERTDMFMFAATETVVDSSVRSLLDCSPEEVLPSAARRPSDELKGLLLLPGYAPLTDAPGQSPYLTDGSIDSSCALAPTTANLSPRDWSASPIKVSSPSGVASPTTSVSSPGSATSLSLLDVSYLTNMADREKGSLDTTQKEKPKEEDALAFENLIADELNQSISTVFKSPCKFVTEMSSGARDPYAFTSHARNALTENDDADEFFELAMTPTSSHGAVGQALYGGTNYRPWSYALEIVQVSDILALNERLSQVWDVNHQRRVVPTGQTCRSRTNFNYSQHTPNLDSSPSFLLDLSTPSVTPFSLFFSSALTTPPPPMESCGTNEKSALDSSENAILSCTDSTKAAENLSGNSIPVNESDAVLPTILDDSHASSSSPNVVSSSRSAISSLSSGASSSSSSPLPQEPQTPPQPRGPSHCRTLVPSVNSAFARVIPRQNKAKDADRVQERVTPEDEEVMRQVNPRSSPRETLYFSPKTHFQPIRSPLPFADTLELSLSETTTTDMYDVAKSSDPFVQPPDLFGGHTMSRSPYQLFQSDIYWGDETDTPSVSFVPCFKIVKGHDKCVQTGDPEENLDIDLEKLADDVCAENTETKPRSSVPYPRTASLRSVDPVCRADRFASVWSQPNTVSDVSAWPKGETGKDGQNKFVNAWTTDPPSGWTPITSTERWPSTFSSPSSTLGSIERQPSIFTRDSFWHTAAGTLSAVRDDAWLSSSSGTPNSGLSTPCTASAGPPRIDVACKTSKIPDLSMACVSPGYVSEEENRNLNGNIWSSNSVDWTVNETTPVYLQVNPNTWATDEGCGETVVEDAFKFTKPELNPPLLSPKTFAQPPSSQLVWSNNIWEPENYDIPQDEENIASEREISTEEDPASEDKDGPRSLGLDSANIWSVPNATMWSLPILTHSSSSSTSASQAASPSSAPSPPLGPAHQLASDDPLLDLVCGSVCTQTTGANKPCQHQRLRKIWEHADQGCSADKKENANNFGHQMYSGRENRPLFGSARHLASVSMSPPGDSSRSSSHWTPTSNTKLSLGPPSLVPLPSAAVYSSELEKQWLSGENSCSSSAASVQQTNTQREKSRSCKKPCSYFLEGNCWRQECKYAHDVCTITCRFWEEMECFKGDTCPFLHGYSGETIRPSTDSCSSGCSSSSNSSSSRITRRKERSPSIGGVIHTSSVAHPSAPPEEFDKECRSLTQSKAHLTTKADPQGGNIPALGTADDLGRTSADAAAETTRTTTNIGSGSDTLPNTAADPGCNGDGIGGQGASPIVPPTASSSPPLFAS